MGVAVLRYSSTILLAGAFLLFGIAGTQAQSANTSAPPPDPNAKLQAVSYDTIPPGARFETQTNDGGELTQETLDLVNQALAGHGYGVEQQAPLVMVIETNLIRGQKQDDPLGQAYASNNEAKVQARLFSTNQNSLLNPQQPIGSPDRIFRISLAVYNRANGLYVWRGSATRDNPDLDVKQASNEMVAELIGSLGRSVKPVPQE